MKFCRYCGETELDYLGIDDDVDIWFCLACDMEIESDAVWEEVWFDDDESEADNYEQS